MPWPAPAPAVPDSPEDRSGTAPPGPAAALAGVAVALSFLVEGVSFLYRPGEQRTTSQAIAYGMAWTAVLYAVVATLAVLVVRRYAVRLRWTRGPGLTSALIGLAVGAGASGLVLAMNESANGRIVVDPSIGLVLSEATPGHVLFILLLLVVVAPVVEETVFRGLFAESLLGRGLTTAVVASAPAFWLWHWRLSSGAFLYLTTFGVVTAVVYRHRGLVGSMLTHATFNGILAIVAISQLSAPARVVEAGGVSVRAPASWHQQASTDGRAVLGLVGPSGAEFGIASEPLPRAVTPAELRQALAARAGQLGAGSVDPGSIRPISLPAGDGAELTYTEGVHHAQIVMIASGLTLYVVVLDDEGSATARTEEAQMLQTVTLS